MKRQLTEVQVENDQLKEAEEVQSKRHKKDQDLIGDRVDQLERENEMAQKEKEIIGTGFKILIMDSSQRCHFRRLIIYIIVNIHFRWFNITLSRLEFDDSSLSQQCYIFNHLK